MKAEGDFSGFEVYVETEDGKRLNEYEKEVNPDHPEAGRTVSCWLETPEDLEKTFSIILVRSPDQQETLLCKFYVDGVKFDGRVLHPGTRLPVRADRFHQKKSDGVYAHKLKFSRLITTDDDAALPGDPVVAESIGQIRVTLQRGTRGKKSIGIASVSSITGHAIPEKVKKVAADRRIVGAEGHLDDQVHHRRAFTPLRARYIDCIFVFHYASRGALTAKEVIEPSPPPPSSMNFAISHSPLVAPIDANRSRIEELEAELTRLRNAPDQKPNIKQEYRGDRTQRSKKYPEKGSSIDDPIDVSD